MTKIVNPFYPHPHTIFRWNGGTSCTVTGEKEIECPEGAVDCMIDAIDKGRSDGKVLCEGRMWSPETGVLDRKAYATRMQLKEETAKLEADKAKEAKRVAKRREEERRHISETPAKVVSDKPAEVVYEKSSMGRNLEL